MKRRARADSRLEFGMTPFVDVVFSLLIFFVVTARFVPPEMRVPVFLSTFGRATPDRVPTRPFIMKIYSEGENGALVSAANKVYNVRDKGDFEKLKKELEKYRERNIREGQLPSDARAVVLPDDKVIWKHVIVVIDLVKKVNIPVGMRSGG